MVWDVAELLALEVDVVHGFVPGRGGAAGTVGDKAGDGVRAVCAWAPGARVVGVADRVPEPGGMGEYVPEGAPRGLVEFAERVGGSVHGGPSFVFPERPPMRYAALPLLVSDPGGMRAAAALRRPAVWEADEWGELVSGALGEWAMAVEGDEAVSICFSPAVNARAAEAGIWTRADWRGRGLAAAAVAAWAERERPYRDVLFYSTTGENHASRAVARSLGLTPLGWLWTVR